MDSVLRPIQHWLHDVHKSPAAVALAERIGLTFPRGQPQGFQASLQYPIRRLVVMGKDTPENFRLLFGVDGIPDIHSQTHLEVLTTENVAKGSPSDVLNHYLDQGYPGFTPRPASDAEKAAVARQLEFNAIYQYFLSK